jgi:hypothetical protein
MSTTASMAVLGGLCALAVVVLAYVVARLSAQVRRLSDDLSALANSAAPAHVAPPPFPEAPAVADPQEQPAAQSSRELDGEVEDVLVITALPDADDGLDITARRVASVTLARPIIKVASLSYGLRRALDDENRFKVRYAMRQEFRRQRKMRRRRRASRAPSMEGRA